MIIAFVTWPQGVTCQMMPKKRRTSKSPGFLLGQLVTPADAHARGTVSLCLGVSCCSSETHARASVSLGVPFDLPTERLPIDFMIGVAGFRGYSCSEIQDVGINLPAPATVQTFCMQ
jgi:hypothetical protein